MTQNYIILCVPSITSNIMFFVGPIVKKNCLGLGLGLGLGLFSYSFLRAFTAVELKSYNAILAPLIYQKHLAAVVVKQKFFADLLQCTSIDRCVL